MPDLTDVFRKTVAVDFDGVIHSYEKGWQDGSIYGTPMPGALEALRELMEKYYVFIFTSRHCLQVAQWMQSHGFQVTTDDSLYDTWDQQTTGADWNGVFWQTAGILLITNHKFAASAYIDDRAIRFESWDQTLTDLEKVT